MNGKTGPWVRIGRGATAENFLSQKDTGVRHCHAFLQCHVFGAGYLDRRRRRLLSQTLRRDGKFFRPRSGRKERKDSFREGVRLADRERRIPITGATQFSHCFDLNAVHRRRCSQAHRPEFHLPRHSCCRCDSRHRGWRKITVRDLLVERSGLADINDLPDYSEILQHHQTPESLVARIKDRPLLFEPGSKFLHEEHSAYNLLALIVEKKTGSFFPLPWPEQFSGRLASRRPALTMTV